MSKVRPSAYGMGDVVRPRSVTYKTTCHQWFCIGASASRVLPTICVQRCSVVWVGAHSSSVSRGHTVSVLSMISPPHHKRTLFVNAKLRRPACNGANHAHHTSHSTARHY